MLDGVSSRIISIRHYLWKYRMALAWVGMALILVYINDIERNIRVNRTLVTSQVVYNNCVDINHLSTLYKDTLSKILIDVEAKNAEGSISPARYKFAKTALIAKIKLIKIPNCEDRAEQIVRSIK